MHSLAEYAKIVMQPRLNAIIEIDRGICEGQEP
jgi:hypothetical protein